MTNTRLFTIWGGMKQRCYNKNHVGYPRYGGKNIIIHNDWIDKNNGFINFYLWANNNGYKEGLTIDRINNNGNYCPKNCRWATRKEQQRNITKTIRLEYNGEIKTITEWSEILKIPKGRLVYRYKNGYNIDKIFSSPRTWKSEKQSNIKGVIYNKRQNIWIVKGIKNNKKDTYIKSFKNLEDAINFKNEYDKKNFNP